MSKLTTSEQIKINRMLQATVSAAEVYATERARRASIRDLTDEDIQAIAELADSYDANLTNLQEYLKWV